MTYKLSFNTDPTLQRVILIAFLLMLEAICIGLMTIFSQNRMPTDIELYGIVTTAVLQLITYILTFLKKEEG